MRCHTVCVLLLVEYARGHASGCTTIVVNAKATVDGSAIVTHSADSTIGDWRVAYVPAKDFSPGAQRTIVRSETNYLMYPRSTDSERSLSYRPVENPVHEQEILGYIPQARHTYALWESMYSLMNEHGLAVGESTCASKLINLGKPYGGNALLTVGTLMAVALERCRTAQCAVETMGDLAEKYGFYGEDAGIDSAGESVTVADADGDAWVFHVTGGIVNGIETALWVAQRVPEGHVAVVANSFTIKEVDLEDVANFRSSTHLLESAKRFGLWDGRGRFNWQASLAPDYDPNFEAQSNAMDAMRMWRVFTLANPDLDLKPSNQLSQVPFSSPVGPSKKVSNLMVMNWHRDTYDGTEFDMRLGALAGPWQSPRRPKAAPILGQNARSISEHWTLYVVISQPGAKHPKLWFAPDSAKTTVFVPFFAEPLRQDNGSFFVSGYGEGSQLSFSLAAGAPRPAWWAFNLVANWLELSYNHMSQRYVFPKVHQLQDEVLRQVQQGEDDIDALQGSHATIKLKVGDRLAELHTRIQEHVVQEWWALADMLIVRYNDQFFNFPPEDPGTTAPIPFPAFWLQMAGFNERSYYPGWMQSTLELPSRLTDDLALAKRSMDLFSSCAAVGSDRANCKDSTSTLKERLGSMPHTEPFGISGLTLAQLWGIALFGAVCSLIGFGLGAAIPLRTPMVKPVGESEYWQIDN